MSRQITLLTAHKGVDLHAATALRVMQERLDGGEALRGLYRCELHTFQEGTSDVEMEGLLASGRYFNPNKHHYGHFETAVVPAFFSGETTSDRILPSEWPGDSVGSDLDASAGHLYDILLGGRPEGSCCACDVASFAIGQDRPLISGVLWRLELEAEPAEAAALGEQLAVARGRKQGLLINPHMEAWLTAVRMENR